MEYEGGTYISQVEAASAKSASIKWARTLDVSQIKGMGVKGKEALLMHARSEKPVALTGIVGGWCLYPFLRGRGALINIIKTERAVNGHQEA
jgi:hypothetical protein